MKTALILNPNQELILIRSVKKSLLTLNEKAFLARPEFPLYIFLNDSRFYNQNPEEIKKILKSAEIEAPLIQENQFFFPVTIELTDNTQIREKLVVAKITSEETLSISDFSDFPLKLKVFRIAKVKQKIHTIEVWNDIWCKLK